MFFKECGYCKMFCCPGCLGWSRLFLVKTPRSKNPSVLIPVLISGVPSRGETCNWLKCPFLQMFWWWTLEQPYGTAKIWKVLVLTLSKTKWSGILCILWFPWFSSWFWGTLIFLQHFAVHHGRKPNNSRLMGWCGWITVGSWGPQAFANACNPCWKLQQGSMLPMVFCIFTLGHKERWETVTQSSENYRNYTTQKTHHVQSFCWNTILQFPYHTHRSNTFQPWGQAATIALSLTLGLEVLALVMSMV